MDFAYDHIAEQTYANDRSSTPKPGDTDAESSHTTTPRSNLQTEFQETLQTISSSTFGTRLGGLWGNFRKSGGSYLEDVRKQGGSYLEEARKEAEDLGTDAWKWSEGLREKVVAVGATAGAAGRGRSGTVKAVTTDDEKSTSDAQVDATLQDNETFIERFKIEAAKRLKEVQKAEDAADEALLRFGTNISNFLRDAVSVTAPAAIQGNDANEILFESKDATTGKRVIHASRFEAQLHVIHTTLTSFTQDPETEEKEWTDWKQGFDVEKKTDAIARDLEKYPELRNAMEQLVPEKVEYHDFWTRYYFLRHVVETQEEKRREMLKASTTDNDEEPLGWDESDDEAEPEPEAKERSTHPIVVDTKANESTTTIQQSTTSNLLKPAEARRSHDEKSVADSEASYDIVSGATSRAPGSPKEKKTAEDESDEEDWE